VRAVRGRRGSPAATREKSAEQSLSRLRCIACSREAPLSGVRHVCETCGDLLDVVHDLDRLRAARAPRAWRRLFDDRLSARDRPDHSGVWRYRELVLPDLPVEDITSKPEGNTNLYRSPVLEAASRTREVRIKHEGENPTLSFKDRGMTTGVSFARHVGATVVACASTGDTSAALASYAAEVPGLRCLVLLPRDKVTPEQLSQPLASGALTVSLPTDFDGCLRILREVCRTRPIYLLNSINPVRIEGQKTIGFEIVQDLDWEPPDWIVVPVGNAGNISAIGKGLFEMREIGLIDRLPRLLGVQAEAAAPLARAFRDGYCERVRVEAKATVASAIRIGDPASYDRAVREVRRSRGAFASATEQEILDAKALVDASGVYICPNSATAVAGFLKARASGLIGTDERVVVVATAHGCKFSRTTIDYHTGRIEGVDPARANRIVEIEADARAIERLLGPEGER
jgi:threonine synthase